MMRHSFLFRGLFGLFACALLLASGCRRLAEPEFRTPPGLEGLEGLEQLRQAEPTAEDFARVFPPIHHYLMHSRATVRQGRFFGKRQVDLRMIVAGTRTLRLNGRQPGSGVPLFDLLVDGETLHVYVPPESAFFQGEVGPYGSPFVRKFGVEPWDLVAVTTIGRRLAKGSYYYPGRGPNVNFLVTSENDENADGLTRIELDNATGLPRRALWERGEAEWRVEYLAWNFFDDEIEDNDDRKWLMPSHFTVHRDDLNLELEIEPKPGVAQYRINPEISRQAMTIYVPAGTRPLSLGDLDEVLEGR